MIRCINSESAPGVSLLSSQELEELIPAATLAWVAIAGDQIAGYLIGFTWTARYDGEEFAWFKERYQDFFYVDQLALAPSFRGRGIGTRLYAELERRAARELWQSLNCEVNLDPPNATSLAFHQRRGFREIGRMQATDGRRVTLLAKPVTGRG